MKAIWSIAMLSSALVAAHDHQTITLFSQRGCQEDSMTQTPPADGTPLEFNIREMNEIGWNDRVSSVQVPKGLEIDIYENAWWNFDGDHYKMRTFVGMEDANGEVVCQDMGDIDGVGSHFTSRVVEGVRGFSSFIGDKCEDGPTELYLTGQLEKTLTTDDSTINLGYENHSWVWLSKSDSTYENTYMHTYLGGSLSFDINVSQTDCACAAHVHLTAVDDEGECAIQTVKEGGDSQQCASVDVMLANLYGFNAASHAEGQSAQCVRKASDVDALAYGPGPDYTINSQQSYSVRTEFWTNKYESGEYVNVTNIKTYLKQGDKEIVLNQDCEDYLLPLTDYLSGKMSMSLDYKHLGSANEVDGQCSSEGCEASSQIVIENIAWASKDAENEPPLPTPLPEGVHALTATCDGQLEQFYVKGVHNSGISTEESSLSVENSNGVFIHTDVKEQSEATTYLHDYLGGSIHFDVNIQQTDCACAANVFLAELDGANCTMDNILSGEQSQCSKIDLMEANVFGFNQGIHAGGLSALCDRKASDYGIWMYGSGDNYEINTQKPYHVSTHFWADADFEGNAKNLNKIITTLYQEGFEMKLELDCGDAMIPFDDKLVQQMALGISSYSAGQQNDISEQQCAQVCEDASVVVSDIEFLTDNSIIPGDYKVICVEDENGMKDVLLEGLPDRQLNIENEFEFSITHDNRSYVLDKEDSEAYEFDLLGACLEFDVDVSDVGCACSAGIQLIPVNEECSMADEATFQSSCATIDIMKANSRGFEIGSEPCDDMKPVFGEDYQCKIRASDKTKIAYGNDDYHIINTQKPYHVITEFMADVDSDGQKTGLTAIKTKLQQDNKCFTVELECGASYFDYLGDRMLEKMAMRIVTQEMEQPLSDTCQSVCENQSMSIKNIKWNSALNE